MRSDQKLLEEAYQLILEEQSIELYHAADRKDLESFIRDGIKPELAGTKFGGAGARQGKGFYLFRSKGNAINQAKWTYGEKESMVVVIAVNSIDPDNFDIDYEVVGDEALRFLKDICTSSWRYKGVDPKRLKLTMNSRGDLSLNPAWYNLFLGRRFPASIKRLDSDDAEYLSATFELLKKLYPEVHKQFELKQLEDSGLKALKYNGTEKIWPIRIEDLQGEVLWAK